MKKQQQLSEIAIQTSAFVWFSNTYTHLRGCLYAHSNGIPLPSKDEGISGVALAKVKAWAKRHGQRLKFSGTVAGVSDMAFMFKGEVTYIELKTATGTQSQKQKDWQALCEKHGFSYFVVRDLETFQQLINSVMLLSADRMQHLDA